MEKGIDYKIAKLEKGPLQRFKNQNLLLKKFGEVGLKVYKSITGKRTADELREDLDIAPDIFAEILSYMEDVKMIELNPVESEGSRKNITKLSEEEEDSGKIEETAEPTEEVPAETIRKEKVKPKIEEEITPIEEENEVTPEFEGKEKDDTEITEKVQEDNEVTEEKIDNEDETPQKEPEEDKVEEVENTDEDIEPLEKDKDIGPEYNENDEVNELTPVEKIIKDKYGEVGIKVYNLIDGQKTAEEIMNETGLSESKLVEILDFMDDEGIIKLEYPGEKRKKQEKIEVNSEIKKDSNDFTPIIDEETTPDKILERGSDFPVETPIKTPGDIVQSLYLRTGILMKFGDRGGKILELVDGKNDIIEIAMKLNISFYEVLEVLTFMLDKRGILLTPLNRSDLRRKYGDEGYSVYKRYGREGLMLYELVGHDMRIGEMAKRIYKDPKSNVDKIVEMFLFIHQILKIDLPVDRDLLYRELGGV